MIYGYARVSGSSQNLEGQIQMLQDAGAKKIYSEHFTGTTTKRPEFTKLKRRLVEGDVLVVTKLDRFARTAQQGLELIDKLSKKGVRINVLNLGMIDSSTSGKLLRTILLAFAEFERDLIVERLSEGKNRAREMGTLHEGRPKRKFTHIEHMVADRLHRGEITYQQAADELGVSKMTATRIHKHFYSTPKKKALASGHSQVLNSTLSVNTGR